ncbi:MBL fold metallo-hydrolase [Streptomyces sp. NPDC093085]|uniref:MBL fold metallo-hydrolase n=1 Tax=Streptomyces sp. NPDC093085 TaxID=3155068 RepID=UPI00342A3472
MTGRRTVLRGVLAASGAAVVPGSLAARPIAGRGGPYTTPVRLRWLGVAGWEITIDGGRTILFDPYLSRIPCLDATGRLDPGLPLRTDQELVERVAGEQLPDAPELVLLSHGHFDHVADVPQLMARPGWRGDRIRTICDETVRHLLAAMGTPRSRLDDVIQVKGGEYLQFDGYTVEVFRSLHSQLADHGCFAPGRRFSVPERPTVLADLVEGDTLAYQVSVEGGPSILLMGASNFVERELSGIRPDVALVPMSSHGAVHRYVERLLTAVGNPPLLIPTHHDDMATPLHAPPARLAASAAPSAAEKLSQAATPASRVLSPTPLRPIPLTTAPN